MKLKDFLAKIGKNNANGLEELKRKAAEKGLTVRVRTYETMAGDFCIFIYDKSVKDSYMVGFDGCFVSQFSITFEDCLKASEKWVKNYVRKS